MLNRHYIHCLSRFQGCNNSSLRFVVRRWAHSGGFFQPTTATVSCLPGLEKILQSELNNLGIGPSKVVKHGVRLSNPTPEDVYTGSLYLGTASNILIPCGDAFEARGLPELRRKTARLPWPYILNKKVRLEVRVTSSKSKLYHSGAIQGRVVAGIYHALGYDIPRDRVEVQYPKAISKDDPVVKLEVQVNRDQVQIFLCAATTPFHRRGYRLQTSKAPLREDLAFAMLYASGWNPAWGKNQERIYDQLLDPMCGSGTIAIEAAAMAVGLPPGRLRTPVLQGTAWDIFPLYKELILEANANYQKQKQDFSISVIGGDRDRGAIQAATGNAERAGVSEFMSLSVGAFSDHALWTEKPQSEDSRLLVVTNPPFGRRVSPSKRTSNSNDFSKEDKALWPLFQKFHQLCSLRPQTDVTMLAHRTDILEKTGWKNLQELYVSTHGGMPVSTVTWRQPPSIP